MGECNDQAKTRDKDAIGGEAFRNFSFRLTDGESARNTEIRSAISGGDVNGEYPPANME